MDGARVATVWSSHPPHLKSGKSFTFWYFSYLICVNVVTFVALVTLTCLAFHVRIPFEILICSVSTGCTVYKPVLFPVYVEMMMRFYKLSILISKDASFICRFNPKIPFFRFHFWLNLIVRLLAEINLN